MFTILTVSLMTKPCFLLLPKRIMYDSWSMFTILTVSLIRLLYLACIHISGFFFLKNKLLASHDNNAILYKTMASSEY